MRKEDEGIINAIIFVILLIVFCITLTALTSAADNSTAVAAKEGGGGICLPGFYGFDCAIVWLLAILLFFIAAMFRKNVANDLLDFPFSLIGASIAGELAYIISLLVFHSIKWGLLIGVVGLLAGGFLLQFFGDTEAEGGE